MYGVEASSGVGGLIATAPAGYPGMARTLLIRPRGSALIGGPPQNGTVLASGGIGDQVAAPPVVSGSGANVEHPNAQLLGGWRQILDFHNSTAPWILLGILLLYAWSHGHVRRRGR